MKKIKKSLRKILFFLLKKLNMPEYTLAQVNSVTTFLQAIFINNLEQIEVVFNAIDSCSSNVNNNQVVSLKYNIMFNDCVFFVEIVFYKRTGRIDLRSCGNSAIPFQRLFNINSMFITPYISFNERKDLSILETLQNLPIAAAI